MKQSKRNKLFIGILFSIMLTNCKEDKLSNLKMEIEDAALHAKIQDFAGFSFKYEDNNTYSLDFGKDFSQLNGILITHGDSIVQIVFDRDSTKRKFTLFDRSISCEQVDTVPSIGNDNVPLVIERHVGIQDEEPIFSTSLDYKLGYDILQLIIYYKFSKGIISIVGKNLAATTTLSFYAKTKYIKSCVNKRIQRI